MSMDSYNGLPLDDDIVDRIMTFCPTSGTLQSTILVCKAFHRVFQAHPKSITRGVAYNVVGPALLQALRVVRYPCDGYTSDGDPSTMAEACPEDHDPNRTSRTSVLTSEESWRFRRAMYRIMLYCHLFPGNHYSQEDIDPDNEELIDKIRKQRTAILSKYPTNDLWELNSAVKFLCSVFDSVTNVQSNITESLLSTGPSGALRAWQARSYQVLEDDIDLMFFEDDEEIPLFVRYFSLPLQNIWTARNITPPKEDDPASTWIVDQVNGANDTCSHCATPGGLQLYTAANWDRFPIILTNLLKKNLKLNQTVAQPFSVAAHLVNSDALGPFLGDLFALKPHTAPAFDNWDQTGSYCFMCFTKFVEEHLWIWFLEERIKGAFSAYLPSARVDATGRLLHLCIPSRGDPA
ncbi:hypothetical protein B0H13DRAFT_2002868 [Mycena leptocephala]|nr:hypothetical protein B0H13DRAFT_2002868 [Mycena leptocephala]